MSLVTKKKNQKTDSNGSSDDELQLTNLKPEMYCNDVAYSIVFNKENKEFELVTIKYSRTHNEFILESVRSLGNHGLAVDAEISMLFNVNQIREQGRK